MAKQEGRSVHLSIPFLKGGKGITKNVLINICNLPKPLFIKEGK
jgi:hypothetical protein